METNTVEVACTRITGKNLSDADLIVIDNIPHEIIYVETIEGRTNIHAKARFILSENQKEIQHLVLEKGETIPRISTLKERLLLKKDINEIFDISKSTLECRNGKVFQKYETPDSTYEANKDLLTALILGLNGLGVILYDTEITTEYVGGYISYAPSHPGYPGAPEGTPQGEEPNIPALFHAEMPSYQMIQRLFTCQLLELAFATSTLDHMAPQGEINIDTGTTDSARYQASLDLINTIISAVTPIQKFQQDTSVAAPWVKGTIAVETDRTFDLKNNPYMSILGNHGIRVNSMGLPEMPEDLAEQMDKNALLQTIRKAIKDHNNQ